MIEIILEAVSEGLLFLAFFFLLPFILIKVFEK